MPRKKGKEKTKRKDVPNPNFTLNDCANSKKPIGRAKKSLDTTSALEKLDWDFVGIDDDGRDCLATKTKSLSITEPNVGSVVLPEIIWYHIAHFIKPEDVGRFAGINKDTHKITNREFFWRNLYKKYCFNNVKVPIELRVEDGTIAYGLRQRVIRSLYHSYDVFKKRIEHIDYHSKVYGLLKWKCANVWIRTGVRYWTTYIKFRKPNRIWLPGRKDLITELGRLDANPEEGYKVLRIKCFESCLLPALHGLSLVSVKLGLSSNGLRHHCVHLGFTRVHYNHMDLRPEHMVYLDAVGEISVMDWWHPRYPFYEVTLPTPTLPSPILKEDFFSL